MPFVQLNGRSIYYERSGVAGAPVLLLSSSLGTTLEMWQPQLYYFEALFDVVRYDMRGHGKSSTPPGPYTLSDFGNDVLGLAEELQLECIAYCGLSIGGLIGQWLAINASNRFRAFVLANTAARIATPQGWTSRIAAVEQGGMSPIAVSAMERWFTLDFRASRPEVVALFEGMLANCNDQGYRAACAALRDADLREQTNLVHAPTLIIAGSQDAVTTVEDGLFLEQHIRGSRLVVLHASHLSNVEMPAEFSAAITEFLKEVDVMEDALDDRTRLQQGFAVRRAVLGDAHVDRAESGKTSLNADFQDFITRYAWGEIWSRPGLARHMRSLITISMLIALNRADELKMHLRAAFNNGVTREELKEVILHSSLYCGLPAANEAYRLAAEVIASLQ